MLDFEKCSPNKPISNVMLTDYKIARQGVKMVGKHKTFRDLNEKC